MSKELTPLYPGDLVTVDASYCYSSDKINNNPLKYSIGIVLTENQKDYKTHKIYINGLSFWISDCRLTKLA